MHCLEDSYIPAYNNVGVMHHSEVERSGMSIRYSTVIREVRLVGGFLFRGYETFVSAFYFNQAYT